MAFQQFPWVPDGTYDYKDYCVRYVIVNGNATTVLSKMWVESGPPKELPLELHQPWGSFPDFPPKPPKKVEQK